MGLHGGQVSFEHSGWPWFDRPHQGPHQSQSRQAGDPYSSGGDESLPLPVLADDRSLPGVPLPASLPLLLSALGFVALTRRRV